MPIYEYKCKQCGEQFELFVFSYTHADVNCINCGSGDTERLISKFLSGGGSGPGHSSCGYSGGFS